MACDKIDLCCTSSVVVNYLSRLQEVCINVSKSFVFEDLPEKGLFSL